MNARAKRSIALILALCLSLPFFFGCSEAQKEQPAKSPDAAETDTLTDTPAEAEPEETEVTRKHAPDTLPADLDFGGETFMIYYASAYGPQILIEGGEEQTGEIVADTVAANNQSVEERLNVDLGFFADKSADWSTVAGIVSGMIMADDNTYDVFMGDQYGMTQTVSKGYYLNAFNLPYFDFDQPWWNGDFMENLQFFPDSRIFLTGDFSLSALCRMYVQYYNKTLYATLWSNPDELYDLVLEGKWTIDKMSELISAAYQDLNGNGQVDTNDRLGFVAYSTYSSTDPFLYCANIPFTSRDEDGRIVIDMNQERAVDLTEKIVDLFYQEGSCFETTAPFSKGNALFYDGQLRDAEGFRDMEDDFGFLPSPKMDEQQDRYYDIVTDTNLLSVIPVTSTRSAMAGAVLEALNAQAYRTAVPAWYEVTLKLKYSRDEISADIIDLIHDSIYTSFLYAYSPMLSNIGQITHEMVTNNKKNYMSIVARKSKSVDKALAKMYENEAKNTP